MPQFSTPIVLVVYNRSDNVSLLIDKLRLITPANIWIIADGGKNPSDQKLVSQTRSIIEASLDWKCKVHRIYATSNLGLKQRIITGLNQVFKEVDQAIILEDDCIPSVSFFKFCQEMLGKYQNIDKVMSISGGNYLFGRQKLVKDSYYFSNYFHVWGWATWKRAWELYDPDLKFCSSSLRGLSMKSEDVATSDLKSKIVNPLARWYWDTMIRKIVSGKMNDTWDYQWTLTHLYYGGISIIPAKNLIQNIGFGINSTHTKFKNKLSNLMAHELVFPLTHPSKISVRKDLDGIIEKQTYLSLRSIIGLLLRL